MSSNRRLNHIFRGDGRTLIVAMDHGLLDGPKKGLERPEETIASVIAGGADAILTSYGIARRFARDLAHVGLIVRADGGATGLSITPGPGALTLSIEQALSVDADVIAISAFPGSSQEQASLEHLAHAIDAARKWNLGVMAEMVPGGFDSPPELRTIQNIALAARVGAEMGADFIKCPYAPDMENVTKTCFVPVVILGGAKRGAENEMLAEIKQAVDEGVAGVAIGRNIWQFENPTAMTRAVAAILHENATVEAAMKLLKS
ncbi:fructose-bisphosphate aldolase, class I [Anaerolineae bacterium]|nr:fructose-bisphosphate aldolase, class I [Anaerolineae bacterium]